jgi:type IX secretion system PorP/SprF family membrane protein
MKLFRHPMFSVKAFVISAVLFCQTCLAQDPYFVQAHNNALYLNPALAGCFISPVLTFSGRLQWPDLNGTYRTVSASYHQLVRHLHGGLGAYYLYDNAGEGTMQTSRVNLSYAVHLEIKQKLTLRVGITGGYVSRTVDWNKLTFGDMIDPRYGFVYPSTVAMPPSTITFFDCGIGIAAYTRKFYVNAAVDHLNEPDESFIRPAPGSNLPRKLLLNAGMHIRLTENSDRISLSPDILYLSQRDFSTTVASVTAKLGWLLLGAGMRINSGAIFSVGGELKFLRLMYSYDLENSSLAEATGSSHELFIGFKLYMLKPAKGMWTPVNMVAF